MHEYGIKPSELVGRKRGRSLAPVRYLHLESGQTWTGRGRRPQWFAGNDSRAFLVTRRELL
ncbi:H-NS family nucleoid-associated regulatory protein [Paraburkholderia sediminicola]|uniref:H-NS family nucleoid-associated regulatory protein n=1 Tax=Paraburkholderia sediminicola TaxID=458836 RepID=UPI0038B96B76